VWVGWPAIKAIVGTRLLPGLGDRILATEAYRGQHTDEPLPPGRKDNLYQALPGDHGAHGRFDSRSKPSSTQLWLTMHRAAVLAGAGLVMAAGAALLRRR
jgi:hypothetical protein